MKHDDTVAPEIYQHAASFLKIGNEAVRKARAEQWREENREALEAYNEWIAKNGLPLERCRQF